MDATLDKNKRTFQNFIIIFLNSLSYFLMAYYFMYLLSQLATAVAALQFDYSSKLYYYKLVYTIDSYSWTSDAVKLLYSIGPAISLLFGILALIAFISLYDDRGRYKMFFVWCWVHGMIWFFGAFLTGTLLDKGIGYVIMYFYLQDTAKLLITLFALTLLLIAGVFSTRWLLFTGNSYFNQINEHNRAFFTFSQIIMPTLAGTALLILFKLPKITFYELFVLMTAVIFMIPTLLRFHVFPTYFFDEIPIKITLDKKALFAAVVVVIAFRVVFQIGIPIG